MRHVKTFRIDQSRAANNEGREIVLDTSPLEEAMTTAEKPGSATDVRDAISGLRNGLMLSAAFWALLYFVMQLIFG